MGVSVFCMWRVYCSFDFDQVFSSTFRRKKVAGSSMPISPSKSRDLADENNKILTEWK
jgi:hypothetical protein